MVTRNSRGMSTFRRMVLEIGEGTLGATLGGPSRGWQGFPEKMGFEAGDCCLPRCAGLNKTPLSFLTKTLLQDFPMDGGRQPKPALVQ